MADESAQPPDRGSDVPGAGDPHRSHVHGAAFGVVGPEDCLRPSAGQSGSTPTAAVADNHLAGWWICCRTTQGPVIPMEATRSR